MDQYYFKAASEVVGSIPDRIPKALYEWYQKIPSWISVQEGLIHVEVASQ